MIFATAGVTTVFSGAQFLAMFVFQDLETGRRERIDGQTGLIGAYTSVTGVAQRRLAPGAHLVQGPWFEKRCRRIHTDLRRKRTGTTVGLRRMWRRAYTDFGYRFLGVEAESSHFLDEKRFVVALHRLVVTVFRVHRADARRRISHAPFEQIMKINK